MNALDLYLNSRFTSLPAAFGTILLLAAAAFGFGEAVFRKERRAHAFLSFAVGTALLCVLLQGGFFVLRLPRFCWATALLIPAGFGLFRLLKTGRRHPGVAVFLLLWGAATLGSALLPPYGWDEQVYQLALPLRFLTEGSSAVRPDNPYSAFPALPNFFYLAGIALGGLNVPRLMNWILTPVLLAFVWKASRRFGRFPAMAVTAAAALSPLTLVLNRDVYVENFIALFTLGGISAALALRKTPQKAALAAGLLAGASVAVKLTGIGGALMIFCFLPRKGWKPLLYFAGAAGLTAIGFYLRPWIQTGNPFYPFVPGAPEGTVAYYHHQLGSVRYGMEGVVGTGLSWLFAAFAGKIYDGIAIGWQWIAFILTGATGAVIWRKRHPARLRFLIRPIAAAILAYLFWTESSQQTRFLFPLFLFLAIGGAAGCAVLGRKAGRMAAILIVISAFCHPLWWNQAKHYFIGWRLQKWARTYPGNFLAIATHDRRYFQALNFLASTPEKSRVLLLFERRGLYVPRRYEIAAPLFEPSLTPIPATPEELLKHFQNFDYILVGSTDRDVDFQAAGIEEYKKLLAMLKTLIARGDLELLPNPGYAILRRKK